MKKLFTVLAAACALSGLFTAGAVFAEGPDLPPAPINTHDTASLQAGARTFVNYCLNCHGAGMVRYNSLEGLGLTDQQIRDNLLFTAGKVGEMMSVGLTRADGKAFFNAAPPDLSVEARVRGADWLYAYLRGFYSDPTTTTGWNNVVFPHVAMPHALWQLQGVRTLVQDKPAEGAVESAVHTPRFETVVPGTLSPVEYDATVRDLVNYLVWMGEPHQALRKQIGFWALFVLGIMIVLTWLLKKEFWKDVPH